MRDYYDVFEQTRAGHIETMYLIAGSLDNPEFFRDLQYNLSERDTIALFPDISTDAPEEEDFLDSIINRHMYGLLAEVHIPECSRFRMREGEPVSWSVNPGICTVIHCYGETVNDLLADIEKKSQAVFDDMVKDELNNRAKTPE